MKNEQKGNIQWIKSELNSDLMNSVNRICYEQKIQSLIVEGGAKVLQQFIDTGNWDEARVFVGQKEFVDGVMAPTIKGELIHKENLEDDTLSIYTNELR